MAVRMLGGQLKGAVPNGVACMTSIAVDLLKERSALQVVKGNRW